MVNIALILLVLPDGRYVFQRRDGKAPILPDGLALFGGHIELGEPPDVAMRRELSEETSLDLRPLDIQPVAEYHLDSPERGGKTVCYHLYKAHISSADFTVYEGRGAEVYSAAEALARSDLAGSARYAVTKLGD